MATKKQDLIKACLMTLIASVISFIIIPQVSYGLEESAIDVSTGWEVLDYKSDLGTDISNVFAQDGVGITGLHYATTNFFNIGNSHFLATKTIPMKKGNIYSFNLVYALRPEGKASGYVDFNGTKFTETQPFNKAYVETVKASENQNYVITMEFTAPINTGMYLMVGQKPGEGIKVTPSVKTPVVEVPEAWTEKVVGTGSVGNTIKIIDASNKVIGTGLVKKDNTFDIKTDRILIHNELLTVTQTNEAEESTPISTQVKDTIAPNSPRIQDINEGNQQIIGTSEPGSKIEISDQDGNLIGDGMTTNEGKVDFSLIKVLQLFDQVSITAIDEAGNKSSPTIATVVSDEPDVAVPVPSVKTPESDTKLVMGNGLLGNTIKLIDSSNNLVGSGHVNSSSEFQVTTNRLLVYKEMIKVIQVNTLGKESEPAMVEVQDTIAPNVPEIQDIIENNQQIIGTAEPDSQIEVRDKAGILIGTGLTTDRGKVKFSLLKSLKLFDQVSVTAVDEAGNKSDAMIVTVSSDLLTDESTLTGNNATKHGVESAVESSGAQENSRSLPATSNAIVKSLPKTGENDYRLQYVGILIYFAAIYMIIFNKKRKWGK